MRSRLPGWLPVSTTLANSGRPSAISARPRRGRFIPEFECRWVNKNMPPCRSQLLGCRGGGHDEEPAMRRAVATRHRIARGAEPNRLAGKDRFERITAGLRKEHLGADPVRNRRAFVAQPFGKIAQPRLEQQSAQRLPEARVDRPHFRQVVHRQARRRRHGAASIAARTRSGVNGICVTLTPTASSMALAIALATPSIPASPMPLAPNGPGPPCSRTNDSYWSGRSLASGTR